MKTLIISALFGLTVALAAPALASHDMGNQKSQHPVSWSHPSNPRNDAPSQVVSVPATGAVILLVVGAFAIFALAGLRRSR